MMIAPDDFGPIYAISRQRHFAVVSG